MRLAIIAALGRNRAIGKDNMLPWRLRTDLARFRALTLGHTLIMGRRTFESIGRPLPGRHTVLVTRRTGIDPGALGEVAENLDAALDAAGRAAERQGVDKAFVVGGAEIYAALIERADILHLTEVDAAPEADAYFPAFDRAQFDIVLAEDHAAGPGDDHAFRFVDYVRRRPRAVPDIDPRAR
jgi:dihydrofolate reductase